MLDQPVLKGLPEYMVLRDQMDFLVEGGHLVQLGILVGLVILDKGGDLEILELVDILERLDPPV